MDQIHGVIVHILRRHWLWRTFLASRIFCAPLVCITTPGLGVHILQLVHPRSASYKQGKTKIRVDAIQLQFFGAFKHPDHLCWLIPLCKIAVFFHKCTQSRCASSNNTTMQWLPTKQRIVVIVLYHTIRHRFQFIVAPQHLR